MSDNHPLTQKRLKERLKYNQSTGVFKWLTHRMHPNLVGTEAGSIDARGYRVIYVDGKPYKAHRLAFLYVYGRWPQGAVDHKNFDPDDNRFRNLREATRSQNGVHRRSSRSNSSGFKGVDFFKLTGRWRARIAVNGRSHALGYFDSAKLAAEAYDAAAKRLHGEFAHLNFP